MRTILFAFISFLCISFYCCVPESKRILTEVNLNGQNTVFQEITDFQYAQQTDSLLPYLASKNPTERYLAARAFASHQDKNALDSLYKLMDDPIVKVRAMSAYAIGQIRDESSEPHLLRGFRQKDTMSVDNASNAAILESIGKLGAGNLSKYMINAEGSRND